MKKNITHALNAHNVKDSEFHKSMEKKYFAYLLFHTATNSMVCMAIGTDCKNGCRYKRNLEKQGLLKVLKLGICQLTLQGNVQYLTTNPDLIIKKRVSD